MVNGIYIGALGQYLADRIEPAFCDGRKQVSRRTGE
jgi:hypothetical protein